MPGETHEPVVRQALAGREHDLLLVAVDLGGAGAGERDAVVLRQRVVAMDDLVIALEAADIEVGVEAGLVGLVLLDQRHGDGALAVLGDVARGRRAARAAADDDDAGLGLAEHGRCAEAERARSRPAPDRTNVRRSICMV